MPAGPVLYLHGFASSPKSSKARYFHDRFTELGHPVEILDLAGGDFEHLTVSGQLRTIERAAAGRGVTLIGSSLGGYLAALYAARHPEVDRLVLMAPAFRFPVHWPATLGTQRMEEWARSRKLTSTTTPRERIETSTTGSTRMESGTRRSPISASRR